jgi:hypothetical protein
VKKQRLSVEQSTVVQQQVTGDVPVGDVCRQGGISEQTCYRWKKTYGGMPPRSRIAVFYSGQREPRWRPPAGWR